VVHLAPAFRVTIVFTVLTGRDSIPPPSPAAAWVLFPRQAHGSLLTRDGVVVGSALIAQNFTRPEYFTRGRRRPATTRRPRTGSNFGPTNQKLIDRVKASIAQYRQENPDYTGAVPADA
jgi:K+-transporting ATPase ATPase C chain